MKVAENFEPRSGRPLVLVLVLLAAGLSTAALGFLALLGWVMGWPRLASFGAGLIPMAPSTALLFLLFGTALGVRARTPLSGRALGISMAAGWLGALGALLLFVLGCLNIHLDVEHLGLNITGTVAGARIGHASPVAAFCFLLASGSFLASLAPSPTRFWRVGLALGSAGGLLVTTFIFLLAYGFGTPLLYSGNFIPPALNTILAFVTLGLALLALAGEPVGLFRKSPEADSKPAFGFALIFFLLAAGIVATGIFYYRYTERKFRAEVERQLSAIAELKVGELAQWREDHRSDAAIFFKNPSFTALVRRYFDQPADADARHQLLDWVGKYSTLDDYDQVRLLDTQAVTRLSVPANLNPASANTVHAAAEALRSGQIDIEDFYRNENNQRVYLSVQIPILDEADANRPLGVLVLRIDPAKYLYPFIRHWPTPSATAETLLLRRDGNEALFLNELRFQTNSALNLRQPLDRVTMPGVQAALGWEGVMDGTDYRGVSVVAAIRTIPKSSWALVARMDTTEVYAPLRAQLWQVVVMVGVLLFGAGAGVGLVWRQQRVRFYQEKATAADALRDSETKFRLLAENIQDVFWISTPTLDRILYVSPAFERIWGRTCASLYQQPQSFAEAIHAEDRDRVHAALQEHAQGNWNVEYRILQPEGAVRWIQDRGFPIRDERGALSLMCGVASDITERKQAEVALREREERLSFLLTSTPAVIYTCRVSGDFGATFISENVQSLLGYRAGEFVADPAFWAQHIHPEDAPRVFAELSHLLAQGSHEHDYRFRHQDGTYRWMHDQVRVVRDAAGHPTALIGSWFDITTRKRVEEAHAWLATAVEQAGETIMITDTQGIILYVNPAFEKVSGYTRAEALGRNPRLLKSGKQEAEFYHQMWAVLERGETWHGHFINQRKDGSLFEEDATISPIRDGQGQIVNYVAVKRDVTHELQLEAQFQQAQKLEAIGQLAGGIAHDFNNILSVILGNVELAVADTDPNHPARASLNEIELASHRAKDLVQQILTYSRQQPRDRQVISLEPVIAEAAKFLHATIPSGVEIALAVAANTPPVLADATQIHQVVFNLCTNAWHALEDRPGRIRIELQTVTLDAAAAPLVGLRPGRFVGLTVSDTGKGMDAATLAQIFNPFFTTKAPGKGTGLGLSVVQGIVAAHDGALTVVSQPGQGTTFQVYFPAAAIGPADSEMAPGAPLPQGQGQHILFLDDEAPLVRVTTRVLERLGYRVTGFTSATAALQAFRANPSQFDVVITDLNMPGTSGLDVVRELRTLRPELPVLLCSGHVTELMQAEAHSAGIRQVLYKPTTLADFSATLHHLFTQPRLPGPNL